MTQTLQTSDRNVPVAAIPWQQTQQSIDWSQQIDRKVSIPDGISPGVFIGKKGINQKQIHSRYKVWLTIDDGTRSVRIRGPSANVELAIEHVTSIFKARQNESTSFNQRKSRSALSQFCIQLVPWEDGSGPFDWTFYFSASRDRTWISAELHSEYPFILVMGKTRYPLDITSNSLNLKPIKRGGPWIMPLNKPMTSEHLDQFNRIPNAKIKLIFGQEVFQQCVYDQKSTITFNQLKSMVMGVNIRGYWINVLDCQVPAIAALYARINKESKAQNCKPINSISLCIKNTVDKSSIRIKYQFNEANKTWEIKSCGAKRNVHALVHVAFPPNIFVQARLSNRNRKDQSEISEVLKWIVIDGDISNVYKTCVFFRPEAPKELLISEVTISLKTKIVIEGILFSLAQLKEFTRLTVALESKVSPPNFGSAFCELIQKVSGFLKRE